MTLHTPPHSPYSQKKTVVAKWKTYFQKIIWNFALSSPVSDYQYLDLRFDDLCGAVYMNGVIPSEYRKFFLDQYDSLKENVYREFEQYIAQKWTRIARRILRDVTQFSHLSDVHKSYICMKMQYASYPEKQSFQPILDLPEYRAFENTFHKETFLHPYWERCLKGEEQPEDE